MSADHTSSERGSSGRAKWTFRLDEGLGERFDDAVEESPFMSRSEALRDQLRKFVADQEGSK